jgi:hypothetical protein
MHQCRPDRRWPSWSCFVLLGGMFTVPCTRRGAVMVTCDCVLVALRVQCQLLSRVAMTRASDPEWAVANSTQPRMDGVWDTTAGSVVFTSGTATLGA